MLGCPLGWGQKRVEQLELRGLDQKGVRGHELIANLSGGIGGDFGVPGGYLGGGNCARVRGSRK